MPAIASNDLTGNAYIDGILGNYRWATNNLSYSFPTDGSYYGSSYGDAENSTNFGALSATQQATVRTVLKAYSSVANLAFSQVDETATQHADLRFALSDKPGTAWAYSPATAAAGGDAWFGNSSNYFASPGRGNYAHLVFLHEIGHTLGLDHSHEGNIVPQARDSMEYTVMSYRSYVGASTSTGYTNEAWGYAQSLMMYDIAGIQHLYGANFSTNSGNTTYSWSPATGEMAINGAGQGAPGGNRIFMTLWDGGGTDTYDFSQYTTGVSVNLQPGSWTVTSSAQLARLHYNGAEIAAGNIANALLYKGDLRSLIENAVGGTGNDAIVGNQAANLLKGGGGADRLTGLGGSDILDGGAGADMLVGGTGADVFDFNSTQDSPSNARDTIQDFVRGSDHIDLRTIDASTASAGDQGFLFIGGSPFTGQTGQLNFSNGVLAGDVNGDKIADFRITLPNVPALSTSDFYL